MNFKEEIYIFFKENNIIFEESLEENSFYLPDNQLIIKLFFINSENKFIENSRTSRSINFWEDVWFREKEICQSRILAMIGNSKRIPARLTKVARIDQQTLDNFLIINHLQGSTKAKFRYGLFLPEQYFRVLGDSFLGIRKLGIRNWELGIRELEKSLITNNQSPITNNQSQILLAVASFSSPRKFVRNGETYRSYELIRFANILHHTVVGGLDKLLKNFIREQAPDDIMTYADADWSDGKSYQKLGFEFIEKTPPQAFCINKKTLERNYSNDSQLLDNQEVVKVFNAGNFKFLLNLKDKKTTNF